MNDELLCPNDSASNPEHWPFTSIESKDKSKISVDARKVIF